MEENDLTVKEIMYILKKRWGIIVLSTLLVTLSASFIAFFKMEPSYEGQVKIFAGKTEDVEKKYTKDEIASYSMIMKTYIELIKTEDFLTKVIDKSGVNISSEELMKGLVLEPSKDTPIVKIKYTALDSEIALKVLSTLSDEFEQRAKEVILNTHTKVIDSTKVRKKMPNVIQTILIGFLLGLVLGIGIVVILDSLDDTISTKEELEKLIPIPVLGELPTVEKRIKKKLKVV